MYNHWKCKAILGISSAIPVQFREFPSQIWEAKQSNSSTTQKKLQNRKTRFFLLVSKNGSTVDLYVVCILWIIYKHEKSYKAYIQFNMQFLQWCIKDQPNYSALHHPSATLYQIFWTSNRIKQSILDRDLGLTWIDMDWHLGLASIWTQRLQFSQVIKHHMICIHLQYYGFSLWSQNSFKTFKARFQ